MEFYWDQNAAVCKGSHFLTISRLSQKAGHNLMCPQGSEQGELEDLSTDWYSLRRLNTAISRMDAPGHPNLWSANKSLGT